MLLRPRKALFKSSHKHRTLKTVNLNFHKKNLKYGQFGLVNYNTNFLLFNKHLFKIKIFLKKSVRRSNITNRYLWVKSFPHIPITKKVIGSRMGKGKGKPSTWAAKIPSKSIFIEVRNLRPGRAIHFLLQVATKLPGRFKIVKKYEQWVPSIAFKKVHTQSNTYY